MKTEIITWLPRKGYSPSPSDVFWHVEIDGVSYYALRRWDMLDYAYAGTRFSWFEFRSAWEDGSPVLFSSKPSPVETPFKIIPFLAQHLESLTEEDLQ